MARPGKAQHVEAPQHVTPRNGDNFPPHGPSGRGAAWHAMARHRITLSQSGIWEPFCTEPITENR